MEQQSGPGGWTNRIAQPSPKPGQMRLWTYQSIAHGADMVLYFRWRTATMGTEIYWHGLNDYHNRPNRRIAEAAQIGRELKALGPRVVTTQTSAQVGIVCDYDNEWDGELDGWHGPYTRQSVQSWFTALQVQHVPVDAVYLRSGTIRGDLERYQVLVYPHPAILTDATAALLTEYVSRGGTLVFGCRTGYKDSSGGCYMQPSPGPVAELCGVTVADFTRIGPNQSAPTLRWSGANSPAVVAESFNDILQVEAPSAKVLAKYASGYYAGAPALVRNPVGDGNAYYYGAVFSVEVAAALIKQLGLAPPLAGFLDVPQPVELCIREDPQTGERLIFLLNYSDTEQTITLHGTAVNVFTGNQLEKSFVLAPFDVYVLSDGVKGGGPTKA
jgi:beta-galactosidase